MERFINNEKIPCPMDKSTINSIIETFDESYAKNSKALYDKYKSVDKFVELSYDYVLGLQAESFEKEMFLSYFDSHVRSMYRRDFEKGLLESEKNNNSPKTIHKIMGGVFWGGMGGLSAGILAHLAFHNIYLTAASFGIGSYLGLKMLKSGGSESESVRLSRIIGTEEYEKKILGELYSNISSD